MLRNCFKTCVKPRFQSSIPKFNPSLFSNTNVSSTNTTSPKMNVDEQSHFEELAPTWWDSQGSQRILHLMNLSRLDFINDVLQKNKVKLPSNTDLYVPKFNIALFPSEIRKNISNELNSEIYERLNREKLTVLDVGCGGGLLSESVARLPFIEKVDGIDMTPGVIKIAQDHQQRDPMLQEKLQYKLCSIDEMDPTKKYDMITMFEMLEHVDSPREIVMKAWELLNEDGGILFLSTINKDLVSWFTTIFMGEQILKVVPSGTHTLSKYINSTEIKKWFEESYPFNYKLLDCKGTMYIPGKGWVQHDYSTVGNYFMAIQKIPK